MTAVRLPTPLRPYAEGHKEVEVQGESVGSALQDLVRRFPGLQPHLYDAQGGLRLYVNVFRNDEDVRTLQGEGTPLRPSDRLLIVPSIAGGRPTGPRAVDYSALRANQATIIGLLLIGFVVNGFWIPGLVGGVMLVGTLLGRPGFLLIYRLVRALRLVRPDPVQDHAEPHLFAQGVGGSLLAISFLCLSLGLEEFGWVLTWIVIALAALNLFGGFCVGCAVYYWLNRLRIPGFRSSPPAGTVPGRRPPTVP
jgi:molybdopterin converting factor small subunit